MPRGDRILVIDDDATSRLKLAAGARALGYEAEMAGGGRDGLAALRSGGFDLVILDLMMPDCDGFEVLREIAADPGLAGIPVLVVSGVNEMADIARAIELGAEDVLHKSFDAAVLRARLSAALERRRLMRAEADYMRQVHRLGAAAHVIEETEFDPAQLRLDALRDRPDDLGRLARVFLDMAARIHRREARMRRRIGLLMGLLLLAAYGAAQGLQPVISRLLAGSALHPLSIGACSLLAGAAVMWGAASFAGGWRAPPRGRLVALAAYAAVSLAAPRLLMLRAAEDLPAQTISLLIALQPLLVFLATASFGVESRSGRRLLGLLIGFLGISWVVAWPGAGMERPETGAVLLMLLVPLGYAAGVVALALREAAPGANQMLDAAIALTMAGLGLGAMAAAAGALPAPADLAGRDGLLVAGLGVVGALATLAVLLMVRVTGAVFASQSGYAATAGGVVWSAALLGEPLTAAAWTAMAILLVGMLLVMPREREPDLDELLSRSPKLRGARATLGL